MSAPSGRLPGDESKVDHVGGVMVLSGAYVRLLALVLDKFTQEQLRTNGSGLSPALAAIHVAARSAAKASAPPSRAPDPLDEAAAVADASGHADVRNLAPQRESARGEWSSKGAETMSSSDVADLLGITPRQVRRLADDGRLGTVRRVSRGLRFCSLAVAEEAERRRIGVIR